MNLRPFRTRSVVLGLAVALLGLVAAGMGLGRLLAPPPLPAAAVSDGILDPDPLTTSRRPGPATIEAALRFDPFRPERRPPTVRFRFPGEPLATAPVVAAAPVRLIGIVSLPGGQGFILAQSGTEAAHFVHVGGTIGGLTLRAVAGDHATLVGPDGKLVELRPPKPGT